jgi:hypothetical protein
MSAKKMSESYNKKLGTLKSMEETGMQRAIREKAQAAVARASSKTQADVVKSLADLKVKTTTAIDSISATLSSEIAALKDVQDAIKAEQATLKSLHDIVAEANSLQALQLANAEERQQHTLMMEQARKDWQAEKEADVQFRARQEEQYKYDTDKRHRAEEDQIAAKRVQDLEVFNASLKTREAAVLQRELDVAAAEVELKTLHEQVAKFEETSKKETQAAVAIATNSLKKDLNHEHTVKTLEFQNTINLKNTEIAQLNNRIAELVKQNQALDTEYKAASSKVQQIAEKAIDGAARQQTFVQMPAQEGSDRSRK